MTDTLPTRPAFLDLPTFLPRVSQHDGRAIEQALAGATLFDRGVKLEGAVVEATYAAGEPPLLQRLAADGVPQLVEPQTVRFCGGRYLQVERLRGLPYAPSSPIAADNFARPAAVSLARAVLQFEDRAGAACYLAAGVPYFDREADGWLRLNDELLAASCALNGTADIPRRPLIAQVVPGPKALANPERIVNRLIDYPLDAVYVQAQRLNPVHDNLEKLAQYVRFLLTLDANGLSVIAGRVGAFGLVLQALGIPSFDSGLNQAEAFDLSSLNRALTDRELERRKQGKGGGDRRIYFELLKTTLKGRHAAAILANIGLRGRFTCTLGCCQHRGFEDLSKRRREHCLWIRHHEVDDMRTKSTGALRLDHVHEQLRDAREHGAAVRRALAQPAGDVPNFDHIDRWIGVLAHEGGLAAAA
jgi:hypothetical protein